MLTDMHRQVDWDGHLSAEGEKRVLPSLRVIISQFQGQPGIIGLHGGLPAGSAFPITSLSFTLRDGTTATIDDPTKVRCTEPLLSHGKPVHRKTYVELFAPQICFFLWRVTCLLHLMPKQKTRDCKRRLDACTSIARCVSSESRRQHVSPDACGSRSPCGAAFSTHGKTLHTFDVTHSWRPCSSTAWRRWATGRSRRGRRSTRARSTRRLRRSR